MAAPTTIDRLDYDGRWIVAETSDGNLFVIDTLLGHRPPRCNKHQNQLQMRA